MNNRLAVFRLQPRIVLVIGIITLTLALAVAGLLGGRRLAGVVSFIHSDVSHESDERLIKNFAAHRAEFEQLLTMVIEDKGLTRVDFDWTDPNNPVQVGVTQGRIDDYRKLMKGLGILGGFSANLERTGIEFITSTQGFVTHGSLKGYLYTRETPLELDSNLDEVLQKGQPYGRRRIEGNWYLFLEKD